MTRLARHPTEHADTGTAHRLVVLGASNVTRGFPALVSAAGRLCPGPVEILGAFGHGRSYGTRRALLWRELPGIIDCGLWDALRDRPQVPTTALLTDVGNDILYDTPVPEIVGWVGTCVERLTRAAARVVLTALPLESVRRVSPARFLVFRSLLFPGCRLTYATVLGRAQELDEGLRDLARQRGIALAEPRLEWYGLDPIHIRRRSLAAAWQAMLPPGPDGGRAAAAGLSWRQCLRLRRLAPERRWLFGRERRTAQPAGQLPGITVARY